MDDANALLEDTDHKVANPVYPEDLEALSSELEEMRHEPRAEWMLKLVMGFFLCVAAAAVVRTRVVR